MGGFERERESVCVCVGALGRMDGWMWDCRIPGHKWTVGCEPGHRSVAQMDPPMRISETEIECVGLSLDYFSFFFLILILFAGCFFSGENERK